MNRTIPKWLRMLGYLGLVCAVLLAACTYCHFQKTKAEARIRHYFSLRSSDPLTVSVIESNLRAYFPLGTPVDKLEKRLSNQGFGVDGYSDIRRTSQIIVFQVHGYSDVWFSTRRIEVRAMIDDHLNITNIRAYVYNIPPYKYVFGL